MVKVKTPYSRPRFVIDIQNRQNVNARPDFVTARDLTQTKFWGAIREIARLREEIVNLKYIRNILLSFFSTENPA